MTRRVAMLSVAGMILALTQALPARATSVATFVSGAGNDVNTASSCVRASPCKTFAAAVGVTDPGGVVSCLDPVFTLATLTITADVTIDCSESYGAIFGQPNVPAIAIATAGVTVTLRGLTLYNVAATGGTAGIDVTTSADVRVEKCQIFGFANAGILFRPAANIPTSPIRRLSVQDSNIYENGVGILINPTAGLSFVSLDHVTLDRNGNEGVRASGAGGGAVQAAVRNSVASYNGTQGFSAVTIAGGKGVFMEIDDSKSVFNNGDGIRVNGSTSIVLRSSKVIGNNSFGLNAVVGGTITSFGNNMIVDNSTNGAPTSFQQTQ